MITRTNAFVTSDQQTFAELDAAIGHELLLMFPEPTYPAGTTEPDAAAVNPGSPQ